MAFTKITNSDLTNKGVIGLPDVPGLSTANMQNKLEETARDVIIPKHNGLIDELEASTAASSIGATAPTGLTGTNVQSLINDLNLKKEDNAGSLPTAETAGATDTLPIRKSTTSYKITFSDLVDSIKDAIGNATTSLAGLFSAEDKTKLDGIEANANDYTLPAATASTLGGIKVGNNLQVTEDGTLSTASGVGDMLKSVYDTNDSGVVDSAESVAWSGVSSKPSTISGYGITDAYTKLEVDSAIPDDLADLNDDSTHRLVTDSDKTSWNGKIANGYKRVKVGTTNVDASGEDAIEFIAGTGMTITPDATNKEITFTSTGGGTNVEGNPAGSATAGSLNKLKIDDDIYSVPQGTVTDAYKTIKVGSTSIDASSEDTFELKAGSNVTLTPDASTKSVTISATGGGQSSGDMLASDYDPNYTVKNTTGGITGYVSGQISDKADKVSSATSGNFAALDSNGNLTDSGHKHSDYLTSHQDISGKADKVTGGTSGNFASLDSNGNLADSGSKASDFLTQHQDITGKADKVTSATNGDFAGLDSNGNLTDSGKKASDFASSAIMDGQSIDSFGDVETALGNKADSTSAYLTNDTAETTIDDADYIPFYDSSATAKKKVTFANLRAGIGENITFTLYSATEDTVTISQNGSTVKTVTIASGNSAEVTLPKGRYTFTSSVAKNTSDFTQAYSKEIDITPDVIDAYVMPKGALYWYGYMSDDLEVVNRTNGWVFDDPAWQDIAPTFNTNAINYPNASDYSWWSGVGTKTAKREGGTVNAILDQTSIANDAAIYMIGNTLKVSGNSSWTGDYQSQKSSTLNTKIKYSFKLTSDKYIQVCRWTIQRSGNLYALWYDEPETDVSTKADISSIGTNESGATASKAYANGENFYKDGKFCTCIAPSGIAQGATFTLGTNYEESTIADVLKQLRSMITT